MVFFFWQAAFVLAMLIMHRRCYAATSAPDFFRSGFEQTPQNPEIFLQFVLLYWVNGCGCNPRYCQKIYQLMLPTHCKVIQPNEGSVWRGTLKGKGKTIMQKNWLVSINCVS